MHESNFYNKLSREKLMYARPPIKIEGLHFLNFPDLYANYVALINIFKYFIEFFHKKLECKLARYHDMPNQFTHMDHRTMILKDSQLLGFRMGLVRTYPPYSINRT